MPVTRKTTIELSSAGVTLAFTLDPDKKSNIDVHVHTDDHGTEVSMTVDPDEVSEFLDALREFGL